MAFAFAASAQAITYTAGTPLATGGRTASVAVNQATGDLYVADAGATLTTTGAEGSVKRFDSSGTEQSCSLSPVPPHPAGLAIDPTSGEFKVVNLGTTNEAGEVLTYPQGCGSEAAVTTGTADTTNESNELTNVSTDNPLQVGQGISGPGIPTGIATADVTNGSPVIENITEAAGAFALGQVVTGSGVPAGATVVFCAPSCAAPTEIELSAAVSGSSVSGAHITARTTVTAAAGSTATLSNPAEATASGVSISGMAWKLEAPSSTVSRPIIDGSGNLIWSDVPNNKLLKLAPFGEELTEGSFPVESGVNEGISSALDAQGNVFVTTTGEATGANCNTTQPYKLKKLGPGGEELAEGGPVGAESVFAGLSEYATTVAVDQSTGNVYVGIGCQHRGTAAPKHYFEIEIYGPGGNQIATGIGSGIEFKNNGAAGAAFNQIAVNEETKTLYAANGGTSTSENVKVFEDTSAQKTLSTSVSGSEPGEVQCNMTGNACLSEYDEGQEVIVEASGENFEEWNGGTGSAEACNGSTETSCTFLLEANSSINAAYGAGTPEQPLTLKINEGEGTVVSNPAGITCTGSSGKECTEEFEEGAEVTLTASPAAGYRFQSWQSCAGGLNGRQCTVTMSEAKEVGVKFKRVYDLTIVKAGSGLGSVYNNKNGLTCTLRCSSVTIPFPEGVSFTLSGQAPNAEFYFKEFTGGTGSAAACSGTECTMTLSEASTVEAVFEDRPTANLSIDKAGGGTAKIWGLLWCSENCTSTSGDFFSGQPSATEVTVHWDLADGTDSIAWSGASGSDTCTGTFTRTEANEGKGSCKVTTNANKSLTATLE